MENNMVGIDIVEVKRIKELNKDGRLEERILSLREKEYLNKKSEHVVAGKIFSERDNSLAGFWASKEAVLKALGIGINNVNLREVEILHKPSGEPYGEVSETIWKFAGKKPAKTIHISVSHDAGLAVSVCFLS